MGTQVGGEAGGVIKNVKIGEFIYTVTEVDEPKDGDDDTRQLYARVVYSQCLIELKRETNPDMKAVALLHEILHAIGRQSGLEYEGDDYTEEKFVITFSHGLLALLRHNPELVRYLIDGN